MPGPPASASLRFEIERAGTRAALRCSGPFVAGTAEEFYRDVRPILDQVTLLLVDLSKVTRMDSAGLGILVRLFVTALHSGRELRVTHVGSQVRRLLTITHLLEFVGVQENPFP